MTLSQGVDLTVVLSANVINLALSLVFLNRVFGRAAWEHRLGYASVAMAIPLTAAAAVNLADGREWPFWALPLVMVAYLGVEFVLDYLIKLDFRRTTLLGPYLLIYYLGLFALIGYAFLADKRYGWITLTTYFINLAATFYSYARAGHGR